MNRSFGGNSPVNSVPPPTRWRWVGEPRSGGMVLPWAPAHGLKCVPERQAPTGRKGYRRWIASYRWCHLSPLSGLPMPRHTVSTGSRPWLQSAVPLGLRSQALSAVLFECLCESESLGSQIKANLGRLAMADDNGWSAV